MEITVFIYKIHINAHFPEGLEVCQDGILICHVLSGALDILHSPPVLPVKNNGGFGPVAGRVYRIRNLLHAAAESGYLPEYTGIASISVIHYGPMEFFRASPALSPLEVLHTVASAGDGLKGRQFMKPRPFLGIHSLPVDDGGSAFHHQEGRFFEASHHGMPGRRTHGHIYLILLTVPFRIVVPGYDAELRGKTEIIQGLEVFHHIGGYGQYAVFQDCSDFLHAEVLDLMAHKTFPVQIQAMQPAFPIWHRAVDLGPVRIGMAPEGSPPGMVQIIQRLVLFLQPFPEGLLALRTMTGCIGSVSAVFIGDMPQDNARMISQMPGQLMVNLFHFLSHNRRGVTEVMPSPRKIAYAFRAHLPHLLIFCGHPVGHGAGRSGKNGINTIFI